MNTMYKLLFLISVIAWTFLLGYFVDYNFEKRIPKVSFKIRELRNVDFVVPNSKVKVCAEFEVGGIPSSCYIEKLR